MTLAAAVLSLSLVAGAAVASGSDGSAAKGKKRTTRIKGHYEGASNAGRTMSFDVTGGPHPAIENFAVDVDVECWNDVNDDGESDTIVAHITGFGGHIHKDSSFDIYYAPDDDTEFEFSGTVAKGKATVDVIVGGTFDLAGTPDMVGGYQCDSWGDTYRAKRS
jgi:hypothetical protein